MQRLPIGFPLVFLASAVALGLCLTQPEHQRAGSALAATSPRAKAPRCKRRRDGAGARLPTCAVARFGTTQYRHNGGVDNAIYAPDGKHMATATHGEVWLWSMKTGYRTKRIRCKLSGQWADVKSMAISPNSRWLAIAWRSEETPQIRLYRLPSGRYVRKLKSAWAVASSMLFSRDSKTLYTNAPNLRAWSVANGRLQRRWKSFDFLGALSLSPNGQWLLANTNPPLLHRYPKKGVRTTYFPSGVLALWDLSTGKAKRLPKLLPHKPNAYAWTRDSKALVVSGQKGFQLHELKSWKKRAQASVQNARHIATTSRKGTRYIAVTDGDHRVHIYRYDPSSHALVKHNEFSVGLKASQSIASFSFAPHAHTLLIAAIRQHPTYWDWYKGTQRRAKEHHAAIKDIAFSPNGRELLTTGQDGYVRQWDTKTGKRQYASKRFTLSHLQAGFRSDGRIWIVEGIEYGIGGLIKRWLVQHKNAVLQQTFSFPITAMRASRDGRYIAFGTARKGAYLYNAQNMRLQQLKPVTPKGLYRMAFWPLSNQQWQLLGSCYHCPHMKRWSLTKRAKKWSSRAATPMQHFHLGDNTPYDVNKTLLAIASGKTLRLLHPKSGTILAQAPLAKTYSIAISPTTKRIATGGDGTILLWSWDGQKLRQRWRLHGHRSEITSLAFSPDGKRLASGSKDTTALLWHIP